MTKKFDWFYMVAKLLYLKRLVGQANQQPCVRSGHLDITYYLVGMVQTPKLWWRSILFLSRYNLANFFFFFT